MLLFYPGEASDLRLCRITLDDEVVGLDWILTLDHAVQAGEAKLVNLSALGFDSIVERTMAQFLRNQVLNLRFAGCESIRLRRMMLKSPSFTSRPTAGIAPSGRCAGCWARPATGSSFV